VWIVSLAAFGMSSLRTLARYQRNSKSDAVSVTNAMIVVIGASVKRGLGGLTSLFSTRLQAHLR
jgi:hypothetical protein